MPIQLTGFTTVPSRMKPSTFREDMDTRLSEEITFVNELNAALVEIENNTQTAENQVTLAASEADRALEQATIAQNSASIALVAVTMTGWVSGTTYTAGKIVYSLIDFKPYIRKIAGAGTVDPHNDYTNWEIFSLGVPTNIAQYQALGGI